MSDLDQGEVTGSPSAEKVTPAWWNASLEIARRDQAIQTIWKIVHTPTKATDHRSAERHFMADFDAIRKLLSPFIDGAKP